MEAPGKSADGTVSTTIRLARAPQQRRQPPPPLAAHATSNLQTTTTKTTTHKHKQTKPGRVREARRAVGADEGRRRHARGLVQGRRRLLGPPGGVLRRRPRRLRPREPLRHRRQPRAAEEGLQGAAQGGGGRQAQADRDRCARPADGVVVLVAALCGRKGAGAAGAAGYRWRRAGSRGFRQIELGLLHTAALT